MLGHPALSKPRQGDAQQRSGLTDKALPGREGPLCAGVVSYNLTSHMQPDWIMTAPAVIYIHMNEFLAVPSNPLCATPAATVRLPFSYRSHKSSKWGRHWDSNSYRSSTSRACPPSERVLSLQNWQYEPYIHHLAFPTKCHLGTSGSRRSVTGIELFGSPHA